MGGKGSGRLSKTDSILRKTTQKFTPIASGEMFLPNHSGDHSAGTTKTPVQDLHIVNKQYVDDNFLQSPIDIGDDTNLTVTSPIVLTDDTLSFSFSTNNTWTGENTFRDEVKGTKQNTIMGHNRNLNVIDGAESFIQIADAVLMTDTKGLTAIRDGSITGISINWNNGIPTGKFANINMRVKVNGSVVWENDISASVGSDIEAFFTQARDTDKFSAGDTISVCFEGDGTGSITMSKIIVSLEYYYDD